MLQATAGGQGDTFPLPALTCLHGVASPASANARLQLNANGDVERIQGAGTTDIGDWISPKVRMANYEVRVTTISGTLSVGSAGVFQALSSTRQWGVTQAGIGSNAYSGTLEIRRIGDTNILFSASISMTATVS